MTFFFYPSEQGGVGELWSELYPEKGHHLFFTVTKICDIKKVKINLVVSIIFCIFVVEKETNKTTES